MKERWLYVNEIIKYEKHTSHYVIICVLVRIPHATSIYLMKGETMLNEEKDDDVYERNKQVREIYKSLRNY